MKYTIMIIRKAATRRQSTAANEETSAIVKSGWSELNVKIYIQILK